MQKAMPTPAAMMPWISSQDATVAASASRASPTKVTADPDDGSQTGIQTTDDEQEQHFDLLWSLDPGGPATSATVRKSVPFG